ncbi:hypothetical protein KFL_006290040 [Klebsormidium nitens]|uniref:AB hydrolase-1 domain-containing protein n=1 Tax=Klebsormidium nitens TaxID=105231 RepID=A0A1Y1ILL6_KLENI|nr:hypothetical protein KFL_006290040 [Klebsormidium nitens]|eukprot:GAQ90339.1 hypothetical protein KFL_006290040 [Klebsormidium nitens]
MMRLTFPFVDGTRAATLAALLNTSPLTRQGSGITSLFREAVAQQAASFSNLAYEVVESSSNAKGDQGAPLTALIIHGLFGSGRNWRTPARKLAERADALAHGTDARSWQMVLVDLRNHGKSNELSDLTPPHDIQSAGQDLVRLFEAGTLPWPQTVIGHSLGGKVALEYAKVTAQAENEGAPKQVWVLDSVPGAVPSDDAKGDVERVLDELHSLPEVIPSRKWLVERMKDRGFSPGLSEWMGSNLKRLPGRGDESELVFNPAGAQEMYDSYRDATYIPFLRDLPEGMNVDIVQAAKSDRWTPEILSELEAIVKESKGKRKGDGKLRMHVLPNAGHWVHMDNPKGLVDLLAPSLRELAQIGPGG